MLRCLLYFCLFLAVWQDNEYLPLGAKMDFVYAIRELSDKPVIYTSWGFPSNAIRLRPGLMVLTDCLKYVGITNNPRERFRSHSADRGEKKNLELITWMDQKKNNNVKFDLIIIDRYEDRKDAEEQEFYWINFCISQGATLFNRMKVDPVVVAAVQAKIYDAGELAALVAIQTMNKYHLLDRCSGLICGAPD